MGDVVEAQKREIERYKIRCEQLTQDLVTQIDVNANLSRVLCFLTDGKFKSYAAKDNWQTIMAEYLEKDD